MNQEELTQGENAPSEKPNEELTQGENTPAKKPKAEKPKAEKPKAEKPKEEKSKETPVGPRSAEEVRQVQLSMQCVDFR